MGSFIKEPAKLKFLKSLLGDTIFFENNLKNMFNESSSLFNQLENLKDGDIREEDLEKLFRLFSDSIKEFRDKDMSQFSQFIRKIRKNEEIKELLPKDDKQDFLKDLLSNWSNLESNMINIPKIKAKKNVSLNLAGVRPSISQIKQKVANLDENIKKLNEVIGLKIKDLEKKSL